MNLFMKWFKKPVQQPEPAIVKASFHPLCQWLGRSILVIPDTISNPYIGLGLEVIYDDEGDAQLKMMDYLTMTERLVDRCIYLYTDELLWELYDIDPRVLIALLYNRVGMIHVKDIEPLLEQCLTFHDMIDTLGRNRFYEDMLKQNIQPASRRVAWKSE